MSTPKLKICGVQTPGEAKELAGCGVDYLGLNFVPSSNRCISLETASSILAALPNTSVQFVALFQDQPLQMVNDYVSHLGVGFVQLHGSESPDYVKDVAVPVIKAFSVDPRQTPEQILAVLRTYPAMYFVLDRYRQGEGDSVKLEVAQQAVAEFPDRIFLAGGLSSGNLENVLSRVRPFGIDIASGVRTGNKLDMYEVNACLELLKSV